MCQYTELQSLPPEYLLGIHDTDVKSLARLSDLEFLFLLSKTICQHLKKKIKAAAVAVSPLLMTLKCSDLMPKVIKVRDFKHMLRNQRDGSAQLFIAKSSSGSMTHSDVTCTDAASKDN